MTLSNEEKQSTFDEFSDQTLFTYSIAIRSREIIHTLIHFLHFIFFRSYNDNQTYIQCENKSLFILCGRVICLPLFVKCVGCPISPLGRCNVDCGLDVNDFELNDR